jgi:hypothetical protein
MRTEGLYSVYMKTMSDKARAALLSTTGQRQGAVPTTMSADAAAELKDLGYIGRGNGLTRKGTIVIERERSADLDRMFG